MQNALVFKNAPAQRSILAANRAIVRHDGQAYVIHATTLGRSILANAEPMTGKGLINLFDRSPLARALRGLVEAQLFS